MALPTGSRLGPYEILAFLGEGGMGQVYRARDTRIGREVALKLVRPEFAHDEARLRRFESEARAAGALNHPNVLVLHDLGTQDGVPYIVTEKLEGSSLGRQLLSGAPLPVHRAVEIGVAVGHALGAAHEKGILHRDVKPDNIFVTRDGRVKLLDFGLASLARADGDKGGSDVDTATTPSASFLGTAGYISPEQIKGFPADQRSDIFALGAVLYEMLSGKPAFAGATSVERLNAILKEEPPSLAGTVRIPAVLERIVGRCLQKTPDERFQSARDVSFALEAISGAAATAPPSVTHRQRAWLAAALAVVFALGFLIAWALTRKRPMLPVFQALTFGRGFINGARLAPNGQTVFYSAAWDGRRSEVFSTSTAAPESLALGVPNARVAAVSSTGQLGVILDDPGWGGTLAVLPMAGGVPRPLVEEVISADFAPDGQTLAVTRVGGKKGFVVEFPVGRVLHDTSFGLGSVRVSPAGDLLAFAESQGDPGAVVVIDREGRPRARVGGLENDTPELAWSADGQEVWFSSTLFGSEIRAIDLSGHTRVVWRQAGGGVLYDIGRQGRILMTQGHLKRGIRGLFRGGEKERDLSWFNFNQVRALSEDGTHILFTERGARNHMTAYLRPTDGSPPVRLADGSANALSPNGRFALIASAVTLPPYRLTLVPTGAGEAREIPLPGAPLNAGFLPDGRHLLFGVRAVGPERSYVMSIEDGKAVPASREGLLSTGVIAPDGSGFVCQDQSDRSLSLCPMNGGAPQPLGISAPEWPIQWSHDARVLFFHNWSTVPRRLSRLDLSSGRMSPWKELMPEDPAGLLGIGNTLVTRDGRYYAYDYDVRLDRLYLADGLR